jgi:polyhydroxyalkanoate synthesis regulator phasin
MVLDGLRGYIQLASGLTDVTRDRARAVVKSVLAQGEAGVGVVVPTPVRTQVGALTDDLLATSRANRDLLLNLVRAEVERSVSRLGLVSGQELAAATRRSSSLERRVEELEDELHRSRSTAKRSTAKKTTAKKASAKKASAKKASAKKTAGTTAAQSTASASGATPSGSTDAAAGPSPSA